jgi:hypothetical protein
MIHQGNLTLGPCDHRNIHDTAVPVATGSCVLGTWQPRFLITGSWVRVKRRIELLTK